VAEPVTARRVGGGSSVATAGDDDERAQRNARQSAVSEDLR
jgi:hypothetical protein